MNVANIDSRNARLIDLDRSNPDHLAFAVQWFDMPPEGEAKPLFSQPRCGCGWVGDNHASLTGMGRELLSHLDFPAPRIIN